MRDFFKDKELPCSNQKESLSKKLQILIRVLYIKILAPELDGVHCETLVQLSLHILGENRAALLQNKANNCPGGNDPFLFLVGIISMALRRVTGVLPDRLLNRLGRVVQQDSGVAFHHMLLLTGFCIVPGATVDTLVLPHHMG